MTGGGGGGELGSDGDLSVLGVFNARVCFECAASQLPCDPFSLRHGTYYTTVVYITNTSILLH